jgi:hypothetical protein
MPTQNRAESDAPFAWTAGSLPTCWVLVEAVIIGGQWVDSIWFNVGVVEKRFRVSFVQRSTFVHQSFCKRCA